MKRKTAFLSDAKKIFQDPKLKGKHIIMVAGHVFSARTGKEAVKLIWLLNSIVDSNQQLLIFLKQKALSS